MIRRSIWLCLFLVAISVLPATSAETSNRVSRIVIHSGWGGLGTPQNANVTITRGKDGFVRDGKAVDGALVDDLVRSLRHPMIARPEMENLGITENWLGAHLKAVEDRMPGAFPGALPTQQHLFESTYTNLGAMAGIVPDLFRYASFDDNPYAEVEVDFEDGSKLAAKSYSYYAFMIPWMMNGDKNSCTFNAAISRAVSALLPIKSPNKERLDGAGFDSSLGEATMRRIEDKWKMLGVEGRAEPALASLRKVYTVERADINSYHDVYFGRRWEAKGPHESNLQATLQKASFPANVHEHLVLEYEANRVDGLDEFLANGTKYETLALSVPWLNKYIQENPKEMMTLVYVHGKSFSDHALESFAADMKARGREDLIAIVRSQQSDIALLKIGFVYWLLFPDHHMMLWRYEGPRGFLNWTQRDFPEGRCGEYYRVNNGGCSGREISPDGVLLPDAQPRDVACVAAWHNSHPQSIQSGDALFDVMDHGRGGYIDLTGKVVIPLCFDDVGEFSEGLARFERDGRWGYLDLVGNIAIQPQFPWAEDFHEGLAHVQATGEALGYDGRWGYINKAGEMVIAPGAKRMIDDDNGIETAFHDGLAMVEVEGEEIPPRKGFIDKTGKVVIPARFTYVYPFSEGLAAATESESGDSGWGFIDKTGKWLVPPSFAWASNFESGVAPVDNKTNCSYIDKTGTVALSMPAPGSKKSCTMAWGDFNNGLSRWLFGEKYGFIDRTGKTLIYPQFDLTDGFSEGLAAVEIGKKWGYIDTTGKMVIEPQDWSSAKPFHNGLAQVVTHGRWGYIDKTGKYVWGPRAQGDD